MPGVSREASVVRIARAPDATQTIGTGFFVAPRHVMTCAHTVAQALARVTPYQAEAPTGRVWIDAPTVELGRWLQAEVVAWRPRVPEDAPEAVLNDASDIAVLRVVDDPPAGTQPVVARDGELRDHPFWAFGFPEKDGTHVEGQFVGVVAGGLLEVRTKRPEDDELRGGFSGAPAWDDALDAVVGMIVHRAGRYRGHVIPLRRLQAVWPELRVAAMPTMTGSAPALLKLPPMACLLDRKDQTDDVKRTLEEARTGGGGGLRLFIVGGEPEHEHEELINRFVLYEFLRLPADAVGGPGIIPLDWPFKTDFDVEYELRRLQLRVRRELNLPDDATQTKIAQTLNAGLHPRAFWLQIRTSQFNRRHQQLLDGWLGFWHDIAPGLSHVVTKFLCVACDGAPPREWWRRWMGDSVPPPSADDSGKAFERTVQEKGFKVLRLPTLGPVERKHVSPWLDLVAAQAPELTRYRLGIQADLWNRLGPSETFTMRHFKTKVTEVARHLEKGG